MAADWGMFTIHIYIHSDTPLLKWECQQCGYRAQPFIEIVEAQHLLQDMCDHMTTCVVVVQRCLCEEGV